MRRIFLLALLAFSTGHAALAQVTSFNIDSSKFDISLMKTLDSIYIKDQSNRIALIQARERNESPARIDSLSNNMRIGDIQNLEKVKAILEKHGWLGPQKVGMQASQALFLVIQHANLKTQEHYLPMIRTAEKNGETLSSNLAIFEDRINVRNSKPQIYGSQFFTDKETGKKYIYPIIDVDNLEARRKAMGMPQMQEYSKGWDLQNYKKDLPMIEEAVKRQNIK
ncbi:DUF6624 domain-containing protein [Pedobacter gandavensis]|uniref:Uncharacterized protein n=1 Tax=Pedobacter gandavensis TaxID=2679963 RepID=A0ABR6EU75_9SPHI|nr:DUF6624 domain-containing protein [Pedobacter gandavensis]MBB2147973.1 hypothetical protein [Pedobacter gandavensis]